MQGQTTLMLASLFLTFVCFASETTDVATRAALMEVERDNAELSRHYAEVKKDNAELKRHCAEVQKEIANLRLLTRGLAGQARQSMTSYGRANATYFSGGGATYIRWGRTSCPAESTLVYKGLAGGSFYDHPGGAANHLCLPEDPEFPTRVVPLQYAQMWGSQYETHKVIFPIDFDERDVPCAVCRSPTRSSAIMIPAKDFCYPGLHREYSGYLMAGRPTHKAGTEYICVDGYPEVIDEGASDKYGNLLHFTVSRCGSLKCLPYVDTRVLSCVVCSQ